MEARSRKHVKGQSDRGPRLTLRVSCEASLPPTLRHPAHQMQAGCLKKKLSTLNIQLPRVCEFVPSPCERPAPGQKGACVCWPKSCGRDALSNGCTASARNAKSQTFRVWLTAQQGDMGNNVCDRRWHDEPLDMASHERSTMMLPANLGSPGRSSGNAVTLPGDGFARLCNKIKCGKLAKNTLTTNASKHGSPLVSDTATRPRRSLPPGRTCPARHLAHHRTVKVCAED